MKTRRRARELAIQALYEVECTGHPVEEVLDQRMAEKPLNAEGAAFLRATVTGVLSSRAVLDAQIARHASDWPVDQMAVVDHSILRLALWEFTIGRLTPMKVAINEAVELAKEFGSESAPRFVNGVLGAIAADSETV
jgi:N utilization substance protein B